MTRPLVVRRRAQNHIRAAYQWYESQRAGLGGEFLAALGEKFEHLRTFPEGGAVVYRNVRRAVVSRFPFLVFYVTGPKQTSVLAVLHHARSPATWPRR
jgi:plasmid stabilization system protein ParE